MIDSDQQASQRVWRLRKRHQRVDAELCIAEGAGVEIQFWLDDALAYRRRWPTRDEALAEAAGKRAELERQGWMEHW